jgi:PAS domain S-box-containing protein
LIHQPCVLIIFFTLQQNWVVLKYLHLVARQLLLGVFLLAVVGNNFGNTVDSLTLLLKQKGIVRESIYLELASYYLKTNDSLCVSYAQKVLKSSDAPLHSDWRFQAHLLLAKYYQAQMLFEKSFTHLQQAQPLAGSLMQKAQTDIALAELSIKKQNAFQAIEYLRLAKNNIDNNEIGFEVYLFEGVCFNMLNEPDIAKTRFDNALKIAQVINKPALFARIYYQLGDWYFNELMYPQAFYHIKESVKNQGTDTISDLQAQSLLIIGQIYHLQSEYNRAYKYFAGAARIFSTLRYKAGEAQSQLLLAKVSLQLKQYNNALMHVKLADLYFESINSKEGIIEAQLEYAQIYIELNELARAAAVLQRTMTMDQNLFNNQRKYNLYFTMATWQYKTKNYHDAIESLNTALEIATKCSDYYKLAKVYETLSLYQYDYGKYKASIENLQLANNFSDSLYHLLHNDELRYLQSEHETNRTQTVIDILTRENRSQTENLKQNRALVKKQNSIILTAAIFLSLTVIIAFILALWLQQKRKANDMLAASNRQIAQQKEEIEVQRQYLLDINAELEKLSIVARETYNGVKVLNESGKVIWINEGYTKMFGFTLFELQEMGKISLMGDKASADINQLVNVWYGDKKPITFESLVKTKWGNELWVQTTLTPILDSKGKIEKMIAIDTDITQLKLAEEEIRVKNFDITSSINYAKRIQEAMMPPIDIITENYPDSFIYYKPKSIVSGDFYWMTNRHERLIVVCADSTGHGVPGAFMSLIGITFLNKIVNEKGFVSPSVILNRLRMNIISHLHQNDQPQNAAGDGMDVSIVSIDRKNMLMEYAGAMNPMYIVRDNNLIELKPDRMPVGFFDNENRPFSSTSISLKPNDQLYMFTDGYYDQFGGLGGSKMKSSRFKEILKGCALKPVAEQEQLVKQAFDTWRGNNLQVDDVLLIGITIS